MFDIAVLLLVALVGIGMTIVGIFVNSLEVRVWRLEQRDHGMKAKTYPILARAVEDGMQEGITRVFRYTETQTIHEAELREQAYQISEAILAEICEWVTFEDDES